MFFFFSDNDIAAQRMRQRRKDLNLSLAELSDLTGISKSSLQRYETNSGNMKQSAIVKISKALDITPMYLLGLENIEVPTEELTLINDLVSGSGYKIEYNNIRDQFDIYFDNKIVGQLTPFDLHILKDKLISYAKFSIQELL